MRQRAEHGDARAQFELGSMYERGSGLGQDHAEALRWYRKAAQQGDAPAQASLGFMYQDGTGVIPDYAEALRWYRKAAAQGDASAQSGLRSVPQAFTGVSNDQAETLRWCFKAAEQGEVHAQYRLGSIYDGAAADYAEAARWYRKAADQGHRGAQFRLADVYFFGEGGTRDFDEAARWYRCPKPAKAIPASCTEITYANVPDGATALLEQMHCDASPGGSYESGSAFDLNGDGSPEYQFCCHEAPHGPCGSALIGKVGNEWKDLTAKQGGLLGFAGACDLVLVLESERDGFHDICLPLLCASDTGRMGIPCAPVIWRYDGGRYRRVDSTTPMSPK